ncbi:carboxymuconolactone decarboxylase family protein [Parasulfuritortus cantonensis]|uniref:Carboxymuconolactone decarboxylase family protein n=1 Tax=Parasulfuritortus cantonensis TaxID=2528202 RepID=A0A4R1BN62_9PROT|nr:carboxymuconolactone decarboxylase family protein [Parasulfuritortus cantonensis]TCJ18944.1 carboxymuconolactone decarboxylase family protein [Parasulfuritortus cantonensis]
MAHIDLPEYADMAPEIQAKARPILERTGKLGEIFKLLAVNERVYFATDQMAQSYLLEETTLSFQVKEAIALLVSQENGCQMCVGIHKRIARMLGMSEELVAQVLQGIDAMAVPEPEKALLRFCLRASHKDNYKILKSDIDALKALGYSDVQIVEAVAVTGYFNYINTLSNVFALGD